VHLNNAGRDGWEVVGVTETSLTPFGRRRMRRYTLRRTLPQDRPKATEPC
jgi:hypothetical protein